MSRRVPSRVMIDAREQAREGAVTRAALTPEFDTPDDQLAFFAASLRAALSPALRAEGIVGPADWKVFRDLLRHAEPMAGLGKVENLESAVDAVLTRAVQRRRAAVAREALAELAARKTTN